MWLSVQESYIFNKCRGKISLGASLLKSLFAFLSVGVKPHLFQNFKAPKPSEEKVLQTGNKGFQRLFSAAQTPVGTI